MKLTDPVIPAPRYTYDIDKLCFKPSPKGEWVRFKDHEAEVERMKAEIMALRGALGYEVPADTPDNLFVNGIAEALHKQLAAKDAEIAALKEEAEKERKRRLQSPVDRLHNICFGLAKCPNCGFDFEEDEK